MAVADLAPSRREKSSPALQTQLTSLQRAEIRERRRTGICLTAATVVWLLAMLALADHYLVLPWLVRAAGLVGVSAVTVVLLREVHRRLRYDETDAAADVEAAFPEYGQRLRTTWDYTTLIEDVAPAAPYLVESLRYETEDRVRAADLSQLASPRPFRCAAGALGVLGLLCLLCLAFGAEARTAAGRTLLLPLHYTEVTLASFPDRVRRGEDVTLEVEVQGRPIASAEIHYRYSDGKDHWRHVSLLPPESDPAAPPEELSGKLLATLNDLEQDVEFFVVAGPVDHSTHRITVLQPLTLEKFSAHIEPPSYTRLNPQAIESEDLKAPEGSHVALHFTLSRAPSDAQLVPDSAGSKAGDESQKTLASAELTIRENTIEVELPNVRQSLSFRLAAKTADGISLDSPRYRLRVLPDKKPELRLLNPPEELEVIPTTEVPFVVEASDDYGLSRVGLACKVGEGPMTVLWEQASDEQTSSVRGQPALALEDYPLTYQDAVTYYAFAEDNYFGQPRRTATELRFIDIRPFKREYQIAEGGGACNGCSAALEELIARQRDVLRRTFAAQEPESATPEIAARLGQLQSELREATSEFAMGLAMHAGAVPPLDNAVVAMEQAVEALTASDLDGSLASEEKALAELIKSRQNLRQILRMSNSSSASQCRAFDKQQQQKLRPPEKKETPQPGVAEMRSEIEKLAKQQRQWSQDVRQSSPSSQPQQQNQASQQGLAERQAQASQQADELRKQLAESKAGSEMSQRRLDEAAEAIQSASEAQRQGQDEQAAAQASQAADQLERLSEHLAALNAADFAQRLARAQQAARDLADRQQQLAQAAANEATENSPQSATAGKELAETQSGLAERGEALAELVSRLSSDAREEDAEIGGLVNETRDANPPQEIVEAMQSAAEDFASGQPKRGAKSAETAAQNLQELALGLQQARDAYAQPQLDELLAVEERAAKLLEDLLQSQTEGERAMARSKLEALEEALQRSAANDRRLREAIEAMKSGAHAASDSENARPRDPRDTGLNQSDQVLAAGLRQVAQTLQTKIQEAILAGALLDPDQAVPPEYQKMVEEYYRELSEDLR